MSERVDEIIRGVIESSRKVKLSIDQSVAGVRAALDREGFLRDPDEAEKAPAKRDPLTSEIRWSTDFSKPPEISYRTQIIFLRWCSEFRMECFEASGEAALHVFAARAAAASPLKIEDSTYEPLRPKEFAWAMVVGWPAAAHEAIAERLQAEADRFARQAKEARDMAA